MSGAATRVFVSRLAGLAVFDPRGDQVGRVRDAVAALRPAGEVTRVVGLVVEVGMRRPIFVPMGRVTSMDRGQVITTGVVNLRRFEQRNDETLVIAELLDRKVRLLGTDDEVTVIDIGMEMTRNLDWVLSKVHVRKGGGKLRRRGETLTVAWDGVEGLTAGQSTQAATNMLAAFENLRPADLANVLHDLKPERRAQVASALDVDKLADVLEELPEEDQVEIVGLLDEQRAVDVLEAMQPDDAADLLGDLPTHEAEKLLDLMAPEEAAPVRQLLSYADHSAGGLMTTEAVILPPTATVAEALAAIRNPELTPAMAALVYVCRAPLETPTGKFLGAVHFQRLLRTPPGDLVSSVLDKELKTLRPETMLSDVASYLATYNAVAAPVVDAQRRLVGVISVDDVLDHLLPEDWRNAEAAEEPDDDDTGAGGRAFSPDTTGEIRVYRPRKRHGS
ncbi:magnesium transporter MgtE N-terminal domain-containing protein [Sporichthya polymorpha]|uniref:magnesium transporter MgtE N-terminal domain-containing protein n=1 Tax=Sporichthya polymorpha TaxID=35751 RepID=UPI0003675CE4|nr:CBS domain-containing protein [Sporichthya polymorpha]